MKRAQAIKLLNEILGFCPDILSSASQISMLFADSSGVSSGRMMIKANLDKNSKAVLDGIIAKEHLHLIDLDNGYLVIY